MAKNENSIMAIETTITVMIIMVMMMMKMDEGEGRIEEVWQSPSKWGEAWWEKKRKNRGRSIKMMITIMIIIMI